MNPSGLEGVVVSTSSISDVNGTEGRLIYQGIDIHELAEKSTFEEVVHLLWHGTLPTADELVHIQHELAEHYGLPDEVVRLMQGLPKDADPMDVLRTAVSALGMYDPDRADQSREANWRKALRLTAQMGTLVAVWQRVREAKPLLPIRKDLSVAAHFLYQLNGEVPDESMARTFDVALILHADHEFNASTFAARQTVSTLADMYAAITSAVGCLSGPLHGGANTAVMKMLLEIGSKENVLPYLEKAFAEKKKIMGFGHRVYKTMDPRAIHLREMSKAMSKRVGNPLWIEMSEMIEQEIISKKGLNPNVDFFSASAYYTMGIPMDLYTPIFAVSRVSGWTAHVMEQLADNRLIRPRADYVGPRDVPYVPIEERGAKHPVSAG